MLSVNSVEVDQAEYRVAVLLSAYGNSPFLRCQLESIRNALTPDDILIVVDDGSRLVVWEAFTDWPTHFLCWSRLNGLGSARSFWELLLNVPTRARYYCWADQDDIWHTDKLQRQIAAFSALPDALACVHGWRYLRQISDDAWLFDHNQAPTIQCSPAHYCFETPAPGMTLCITEMGRQFLYGLDSRLCERLLSTIPHDRLACAVFGAYGRMIHIKGALVDYRQHEHNQIGAPRVGVVHRNLRRVKQSIRIWHTVWAGIVLYSRLRNERAMEGQSLPPLDHQRLRSRTWENIFLQLMVYGLRIFSRDKHLI